MILATQHNLGDRRGMDEASSGGFGRFGRMFDAFGPEFDEDALAGLAETMIKDDEGQFFNQPDEDENELIPSGYTYLGQFIDHDLTFDQTAIGEREDDPAAIENFRTARLDLDSVYGRGPIGNPEFYDDRNYALLVGREIGHKSAIPVQSRFDHIRGPNGRALIGDPRNDENRIVAQLHTAVIAFHNKVIGDKALMRGLTSKWERFRRAAQITRWHYQWVVVHDFLRRITQPEIFRDVLGTGSLPRLRYYRLDRAKYPFIPIEFSGAAYRFGHSMVRPSYALNLDVGTQQTGPKRLPIFDASQTSATADLRGFQPIPDRWGIDWGYFLDLPGKPPKSQQGKGLLQPAYRIDTLLSQGLARLPDHAGEPERRQSLPFLNLLRGSMLRLPTAEQVASFMSLPTGGVGRFPVLDPEIIWSAGSRMAKPDGSDNEDIDELRKRRSELAPLFRDGNGANHTPLWYYVLREAEWYAALPGKKGEEPDIMGGRHLGPMGSTIVLETFMALLIADRTSIVHKPGWRPMEAISPDPKRRFELADFIRWALT